MRTTKTITLLHVMTVPQSLGFLRGQVVFMKQRGFKVHAVTSPGEVLTSFGRSEGVTTHGVYMEREISPIRDLVSLVRLTKLMRDLRPDIVHSHTPKGGLLGMIAAYICRVPIRIYHVRGFRAETETGARRVLLTLTERIACRLAHRVLCVSYSLRKAIVQHKICPSDKILVLLSGSGNGVDATCRFNPKRIPGARSEIRRRFGIPDSARVVGFVGRIVRDKGIVELFEAWSELREEFPDLHLLMIGEPEPVDPVPLGLLDRLRGDARVHVAGSVKDVPSHYAAMDIVVLPTYREGFPNVLLEAAAMELPVVSTRVTGAVDAVVDGVTGTLVAPRDAQALAQAIRAYLHNPGLARSHGLAGRKRVLVHYRPEAIWTAQYDEYVRLAEIHRP